MPIDTSIAISNSVGQGGRNGSQDVETIQRRLNALAAIEWEKLSVDGKSGPKTQGMIGAFQKQVLKFSYPDNRVDPNGKTIGALNDPASEGKWQNSSSGQPVPTPVPPHKTPAAQPAGQPATQPPAKPAKPATPPKPDDVRKDKHGNTVVASGQAAIRKALLVLEVAGPVYGTTSGAFFGGAKVEIPPGTIDKTDKKIILGQTGGVFWMRGDHLYFSERQRFIDDHSFMGMIRDARDQTRWIVPVANAMAESMLALGLAIAGPLGKVAGVTIICVKAAVFYDGNKKLCDRVIVHLPVIYDSVKWLARHCPKYTEQIARLLGHGFFEAVKSAPDGVSGKQGVKMLGKLIGTIVAKGLSGSAEVTFSLAAKGLAKSVILAIPSTGAKGVAKNAKADAKEIIEGLRAAGLTIGMSEAEKMAAELSQPDAIKTVVELAEGMEAVASLLDQVSSAYQATVVR